MSQYQRENRNPWSVHLNPKSFKNPNNQQRMEKMLFKD